MYGLQMNGVLALLHLSIYTQSLFHIRSNVFTVPQNVTLV